MKSAHDAVQRPRGARLLVVDARGHLTHMPRALFADVLRPGDLVIANDAATLPASLHGWTSVGHPFRGAGVFRGAEEIEVRLAGRSTLEDVREFVAVVFGAGDYRTRTEDRLLPPPLAVGDRLTFPALTARVEAVLGHPRLLRIRFDGTPDAIWNGLARHGRPIQYAHLPAPLALWDVWTPIAAQPAAFEPPSAGFVLDWRSIGALRDRGVAFATVTLAAGISSTGDPDLDRRFPLDEPYRIPESTAASIRGAQERGGRIIAIGTTVVRALEHAAARDGAVHAGDGVATQRLGRDSRLRVVDAILSGTHEPGTSHYQLLRAFVPDAVLSAADAALEAEGYFTHEFGDSIFIERSEPRCILVAPAGHEDSERPLDIDYGDCCGGAGWRGLSCDHPQGRRGAAADRPAGRAGRSEPGHLGRHRVRSLQGRVHRRRHQVHARDDRPPRAGGGDGRPGPVAHPP